MKVVFSPRCLEYEIPGHPENPERVKNIYSVLNKHNLDFLRPEPARKEDILKVHSEEHVKRVLEKDYLDLDTPVIDPYYPLLSAGCAIKAAKILGFALTRPPGHHSGVNSLGGFCYFNNIAIAVECLGKRTAILDIDVHHGQGTEEIFFGRSDILYISLHQRDIYPGTGLVSRKNCINYPLPPGTDESLYLKTLEKALAHIKNFEPEVLGISLGLDTYWKDPLSDFSLRKESYELIGKRIASLDIPAFIVLEGGYSNDIGILTWNFIKSFP